MSGIRTVCTSEFKSLKKIYALEVERLRSLSFFLLLILLLASCSKQVVEKKIILEEPIRLEKPILGVIPEAIMQKAEQKYGPYARNRYEAYNAKLRELQNSSTEVKLEEINNFFNKVPYGEDMEIWGKQDYWATPLEFLGKDKGDCEDYVIAKYFSLRDLGVESEKLYFSYVKASQFTRTHIVLSYFKTPSAIPLILDSINFKILAADERKDLTPIYNLNGDSLYRVSQKGQNGEKIKNNVRIHERWNRLIDDVKRNKL